jgi:tight adherence protein C
MNRVALVGLACGFAFLLLLAIMWRGAQQEKRLATRLSDVSRRRALGSAPEEKVSAIAKPLQMLVALGSLVLRTGLLSPKTLAQLEQTLLRAGLRPSTALSLFVSVKLLLSLSLPALTWIALAAVGMSGRVQMFGAAAAACVGLVSPDMIIRRNRGVHLKRLEGGLADALDLMVICTESGLGLEPAIQRVGQEIRHAHPAVADELDQTTTEFQLNPDPRVALLSLGQRTALVSYQRLGVTMLQSLQYGTPLSQALRVLSAEMREEMLTRFEEKAAKLPVLLTMPMIVFILPTIFIVVGGPAVIQVLHGSPN